MTPKQVPRFIAAVMMQIHDGIDLYNASEPPSRAGYPSEIDIHLDITDEDGEFHQTWMKVPFQR